MKGLAILIFLGAVLCGTAGAAENAGSVGFGHGVSAPGGDSNPCLPSPLFLNYDGSAENGFCWQYAGIVPPYYGAFAERYESQGFCGIQLHLTGIGYPCGPLTAIVWADAGGIPGNVLSVTPGLNPCPVATWPSVSTHDFAINTVGSGGVAWIGYWATSPPNRVATSSPRIPTALGAARTPTSLPGSGIRPGGNTSARSGARPSRLHRRMG